MYETLHQIGQLRCPIWRNALYTGKSSDITITYTMTPHILSSNLPQIHLNNYVMCRFQFLPYAGVHRFQQAMSTTFTLNV